jgi:hypothetical protein
LLRLLSLFTSDAKRPVIRLSIAILKRRYRNVRAAGPERHTPTSQLDWLISTTAILDDGNDRGILVKGDTALFKSFRLVFHQSAAADMSLPPSDSISHRVVRLERKWEGPRARSAQRESVPARDRQQETVSSFGRQRGLSSHPSDKSPVSLGGPANHSSILKMRDRFPEQLP